MYFYFHIVNSCHKFMQIPNYGLCDEEGVRDYCADLWPSFFREFACIGGLSIRELLALVKTRYTGFCGVRGPSSIHGQTTVVSMLTMGDCVCG